MIRNLDAEACGSLIAVERCDKCKHPKHEPGRCLCHVPTYGIDAEVCRCGAKS